MRNDSNENGCFQHYYISRTPRTYLLVGGLGLGSLQCLRHVQFGQRLRAELRDVLCIGVYLTGNNHRVETWWNRQWTNIFRNLFVWNWFFILGFANLIFLGVFSQQTCLFLQRENSEFPIRTNSGEKFPFCHNLPCLDE